MYKIKILLVLILMVVGFSSFFIVRDMYQTYPKKSPSGEYILEVVSGETVDSLAKKLEKERIIHKDYLFILKTKLKNLEPIQVGQYKLDLPANPENLLSQINKNSLEIAQKNSMDKRPFVNNILFREGITVEDYAQILEKNEIIPSQDFLDYIQNPDNFKDSKYSFLPEPLDCVYGNISKCPKYYLEGYLYPDTYSFFKNSTPEEVADKFLVNFQTKVWQKVDEKDKQNFDKKIILASVVEKETGRTMGVTEENKDEFIKEKSLVASVFENRVENNMKWQSNPTVDYGTGFQVCERTINISNCKYLDDKVFQHLYNTYYITGYPIGPITSPSFESIYPILNPIKSDYLFFVADDTGKTYFAKTNAQHEANIILVQEINRKLAGN